QDHLRRGTMTTRWARFARGWSVALISTLLAALSHTVGGGAAPALLAVVVSLAFAGILCVGLAGRTLSLARVTASVLLSQVIFHALFSFGAAGGSLSPDEISAAGAHGHTSLPGLPLLSGAAATTGGAVHDAVHDAGHADWMMWLAHGTAAIVTVAALRYGEQTFWGFVEFSGRGMRALTPYVAVPLPAPPTVRRTPLTAPLDEPRDLGVLLVARPHRGPPAFALAA
ncbi:MAG: hypothetical protein R6W83_07950, partial [Cryobacterium sp.]